MAIRTTDLSHRLLRLGRASRATRAGGQGPELEILITMEYWA